MSLIKLTENISYLPATLKPFSCDVVFIKTNKATWIFDAGMSQNAADEINRIESPKNIVISHFHPDHIFNLTKVKCDNLYVSKYTKRYTFKGTVIEDSKTFDNEPSIQIISLPSSHAKGCLCLVCGDYAFMGDGTYAKEKIGNHTYNAQLLKSMIDVMEQLPCKYFCLSHDRNFVQNKDTVIQLYKDIYARHTPDSPVISVEDYFNADGSVKQL